MGGLLVELIKLFVIEAGREWARRWVAKGRAWKEKLKRKREEKDHGDSTDTRDAS